MAPLLPKDSVPKRGLRRDFENAVLLVFAGSRADELEAGLREAIAQGRFAPWTRTLAGTLLLNGALLGGLAWLILQLGATLADPRASGIVLFGSLLGAVSIWMTIVAVASFFQRPWAAPWMIHGVGMLATLQADLAFLPPDGPFEPLRVIRPLAEKASLAAALLLALLWLATRPLFLRSHAVAESAGVVFRWWWLAMAMVWVAGRVVWHLWA